MALNILKRNHLTPLGLKGLRSCLEWSTVNWSGFLLLVKYYIWTVCTMEAAPCKCRWRWVTKCWTVWNLLHMDHWQSCDTVNSKYLDIALLLTFECCPALISVWIIFWCLVYLIF